MSAAANCALGRSVLAVVVSVSALSSFGCKGTSHSGCDDEYARVLSETFDVKVLCHNSVCSAKLTPAEAHRLSPGGVMGEDTQMVGKCDPVASKPDAKFSTAALSDPCCGLGGSACTHFYYYVVSESAGALCVAM